MILPLLFLEAVLGQVFATPQKPVVPTAQTLALSRSGRPLSFEQVEHYCKARNERDCQFVVHAKVFRDGSGRVRVDSVTTDASGAILKSQTLLLDPANDSAVVLLSDKGIAYKVKFPVGTEPRSFSAMGFDDPQSQHHWRVTEHQYPSQSIGGEEFPGKRYTYIAEDDPQIIKTLDIWYSPSLKLTGGITGNGLTQSYAVRIQTLHLGEPDPNLFSIPAGIKVLDVQFPQ